MYYMLQPTSNDLYHHGILGQKWGRKNGPPYPLDGSDHSASERKAGWRKSINNEKKTESKENLGFEKGKLGFQKGYFKKGSISSKYDYKKSDKYKKASNEKKKELDDQYNFYKKNVLKDRANSIMYNYLEEGIDPKKAYNFNKGEMMITLALGPLGAIAYNLNYMHSEKGKKVVDKVKNKKVSDL